MSEWMLQNPALFRLSCFISLLLLFACVELLKPRRKKYGHGLVRWVSNFSMLGIGSFLLRVVFPYMALEVGAIWMANGWGLFNALRLSHLLNFVAGFVLLDLAIYWQHVAFHKIPALWRVHRAHHADLDFDVSTGIRFHPIEMILSMGIKIGVVALFGIAPLAVLLFEVVLNATSMFTHTNLKLPNWLDKVIRIVFVTPDMHRVHHSILRKETDSNFGFNFSFWDRLFGTYIDQPAQGHEEMIVGINAFRDSKYLRLDWLLAIPFFNPKKND